MSTMPSSEKDISHGQGGSELQEFNGSDVSDIVANENPQDSRDMDRMGKTSYSAAEASKVLNGECRQGPAVQAYLQDVSTI